MEVISCLEIRHAVHSVLDFNNKLSFQLNSSEDVIWFMKYREGFWAYINKLSFQHNLSEDILF